MRQVELPPELERILLSETELAALVERLAGELERDLADKRPLFVVCLKGAFIFAADLTRRLTFSHSVEFLRSRSYQGATSTGEVGFELPEGFGTEVSGRHVVILEDIVDTGLTLRTLETYLESLGCASVSACALLLKPARLVESVKLDYIGTEIPDEFVVGYGLDYDERFRCLPYVAVLKRAVYSN